MPYRVPPLTGSGSYFPSQLKRLTSHEGVIPMSLCRISRRNGAWMAVAILLMLSLAGSAFAATRALPDSTPGIVASAKNLGPANTSTTTRLTIWLQLRYRATLDQLAQQIYTK